MATEMKEVQKEKSNEAEKDMIRYRENLKLNILEGKLTHKRMRRYRHVLRMNEERIPNKVLNMKVKEKHPKGRQRSRWEQQIRLDVTQNERRKIMGRNRGERVVERWRWRGLAVRQPT
jgi:hypothetical protein